LRIYIPYDTYIYTTTNNQTRTNDMITKNIEMFNSQIKKFRRFNKSNDLIRIWITARNVREFYGIKFEDCQKIFKELNI